MMNAERRVQNAELHLHKFIINVLSVLILLSINAEAQSVDSLIAEALQNNPQLKSLSYKVKSAEFKVESTNNLPPPTLGIEFNQVPINSADILNQPISQNLSVSQMFLLGGKIGAMTDVEKKNIAVVNSDYDLYRIFLIDQVKMSYYSLWLMDRKIDVQNENIKLLNDLRKSIDVLYQVNKVSQADLFSIESQVASEETNLITLGNDRQIEIIKLNKLLGRSMDSSEILPEREIISKKNNLDEKNFESILKNENTSLKKMVNMIEINKSEMIANNKEMIPDLMLQGMIMRMPQGMLITSKTNPTMIDGMGKTEYMYSLMASITLPFAPWSSGKITSREDELLSDIKGLEEERNDMEREMIAKMREALLKAKSQQDLISLYQNNVIPLSQKTSDAQTSSFLNNTTNINAVIDSYKMLLMNRMNWFMAQADYQMSLAQIEMMLGKQIF